MEDEIKSVALEDIFTATAHGVLRAISAREDGLAKINATDLVKSGFVVNISIWAGGPRGIDLLNLPGLQRSVGERTE